MGRAELHHLAATTLVTLLILACNGRVEAECGGAETGGCNRSTRRESAFCDLDSGAEPSAPGELPPGPGAPPPFPECGFEFESDPVFGCPARQPTKLQTFDRCEVARECPSACCRLMRDGRRHPISDPIVIDAGDDDAADAGDADAIDASVDAGADASTPVFDEVRGHACICGRCPTPEEICGLFAVGLGGP